MRFRQVPTLLCVAVLLAGCGGDTIVGSDGDVAPVSETTATADVTSPSPSPPQATTPEPAAPALEPIDPPDQTAVTTTLPVSAIASDSDGSQADGEFVGEIVSRYREIIADGYGLDEADVAIERADPWVWSSDSPCEEKGELGSPEMDDGWWLVFSVVSGDTVDIRLTADLRPVICHGALPEGGGRTP